MSIYLILFLLLIFIVLIIVIWGIITKWKFVKRKRKDEYYNKGNYGWALKNINPENIGNIFELGANNGDDTKILSKLYPHSVIIAVEALPEYCDKIKKLKLPNVRIIQKAVTNKSNQTITFPRANKAYPGSGSIYGSTSGLDFHNVMKNKLPSVIVQTITIDDIMKETGIIPGTILMDLQGSELLALKGATATLLRCQNVVSEGGYQPLYVGASTIHDVSKFLKANGYNCKRCNGESCDKVGKNHTKGYTDCLYINTGKLPSCFSSAKVEKGEREVATQFTHYNACVLEFGGGSGAVSTIIQNKLRNPEDHIVIQPRIGKGHEAPMYGGLTTLSNNRKQCSSQFKIIDHVLQKGEGKQVLKMVSRPFDTIVVDCEGCLHTEYNKNPILFDNVTMIQVERDDFNGEYNDLLVSTLKMRKIHIGKGCDGNCATEVWVR